MAAAGADAGFDWVAWGGLLIASILALIRIKEFFDARRTNVFIEVDMETQTDDDDAHGLLIRVVNGEGSTIVVRAAGFETRDTSLEGDSWEIIDKIESRDHRETWISGLDWHYEVARHFDDELSRVWVKLADRPRPVTSAWFIVQIGEDGSVVGLSMMGTDPRRKLFLESIKIAGEIDSRDFDMGSPQAGILPGDEHDDNDEPCATRRADGRRDREPLRSRHTRRHAGL